MFRRTTQHVATRGVVVGALFGGSTLGALLAAMARHAGGPEQTNLSLFCWLLVLGGIVGTAVTARGIGWGWLLLFGLQPLWVGYAVATEQYGFVVSAVAFAVIQLQGYLRSLPPAPCC